MARKRENGTPEAPLGTATAEMPTTVSPSEAASDTNGTGGEEKKHPVMKFGPYAVDKGNNVQVAVWDRQIKLQDGREITVYSCTIQASYFDSASGQWVNTPFFRGSALPIVSHALLKAYDWILEARNEAKTSPF